MASYRTRRLRGGCWSDWEWASTGKNPMACIGGMFGEEKPSAVVGFRCSISGAERRCRNDGGKGA